MHILIAEDEVKTQAYLAQGLTESGFVVDTAADGGVAMRLIEEYNYDAVVLDVMLPSIDGWTIVRQIRSRGITTPILFLTARDGVEDRVKGLEMGGDDYLVKPFSFSELLARLRSLLRRSPTLQSERIQVGDLTLDLISHRAERAGRRLHLTPREFALLALLSRQAGRVFSRIQITEHVWGIDFDTHTNVVDVAIGRLRAKLDAPFDEPLLHTVRGAGYVLEKR